MGPRLLRAPSTAITSADIVTGTRRQRVAVGSGTGSAALPCSTIANSALGSIGFDRYFWIVAVQLSTTVSGAPRD
jgi:hypothetical protein